METDTVEDALVLTLTVVDRAGDVDVDTDMPPPATFAREGF